MNVTCPHCRLTFDLSTGNSKRHIRVLTECPKDFEVTEKHRVYAKLHGCRRPEEMIEQFILNHTSKGNVFKCWDKAFMRWMLNDKLYAEREQRKRRSPGGWCSYCKTKTIYPVVEFGETVHRCEKCERKMVRGV